MRLKQLERAEKFVLRESLSTWSEDELKDYVIRLSTEQRNVIRHFDRVLEIGKTAGCLGRFRVVNLLSELMQPIERYRDLAQLVYEELRNREKEQS